MRIYVASSWKNEFQPAVVQSLIVEGHEVYDFRNPDPQDAKNKGFSWSQIDPRWKEEGVTPARYMDLLRHPVAKRGFTLDMNALSAAHATVMVMPCGLSAGIEFGYATGQGQTTIVYVPGMRDPDLMVKMANLVTTEWTEVLHHLRRVQSSIPGDK